MKIFAEIPLIDLAPLFSDSNEDISTVAGSVMEAYSTVGFAYLINHNVSQTLIDAVFSASHDFHALPLSEKLKIKQNKFFRGFMSQNESLFEISTQGKAKRPNQSEAFIMAHEVDDDDPDFIAGTNLAGPNQWPRALPNFKNTLMNYYHTLFSLAQKMVQVFAVAFGLDKDALNEHFIKPTTFLRLQYYPEQSNANLEEQYGIAPHTDYGFFTLLAQDDVGGLQVKNQLGEWVDVPPLPGSFVLNTGDMIKRMTNNYFLSTPHRVINTSGRKRFSIPFFFEPQMHTTIKPLSVFCSDEHPAQYPAIEYAEHLMARIRGNYSIGA